MPPNFSLSNPTTTRLVTSARCLMAGSSFSPLHSSQQSAQAPAVNTSPSISSMNPASLRKPKSGASALVQTPPTRRERHSYHNGCRISAASHWNVLKSNPSPSNASESHSDLYHENPKMKMAHGLSKPNPATTWLSLNRGIAANTTLNTKFHNV